MKKTNPKVKVPKIEIEEEIELKIPNAKASIKKMFHNRWLLAIKWVFLIIFGAIALALPELTLLVILRYLAVLLVMLGVFLVVGALGHLHDNKHWYMWLIEGLFDIAIGVFVVFNPDVTLQLLILVLAIWAVVKGIIHIIHAIKVKRHIGLHIFNAIILIIFGAVLFSNPFESAVALTYILGVCMILFGIGITFLGWKFRHLDAEWSFAEARAAKAKKKAAKKTAKKTTKTAKKTTTKKPNTKKPTAKKPAKK